jgi:hypothetical protein
VVLQGFKVGLAPQAHKDRKVQLDLQEQQALLDFKDQGDLQGFRVGKALREVSGLQPVRKVRKVRKAQQGLRGR